MVKHTAIIFTFAAAAIVAVFILKPAETRRELKYVAQYNPSTFHNFNYYYDYEYNFTPQAGQSGRVTSLTGKNIVLAAIVPDTDLFPYKQFVDGIRNGAAGSKAGLLVYSLESSSLHSLVSDITKENIDGVILYLSNETEAYEEVKRLKQANIPIVTVWENIDWKCLDFIDSFVGYSDDELGKKLALWLTQDFALSGRPVVLIADEGEAAKAEACRAKLVQSLSEDAVSVLLWSDDCENIISLMSDPIIVSFLPSLTPSLVSGLDVVPNLLIAAGESGEISVLANSGLIDGSFNYSRLLDGELAVEACVQAVNGVKSPARLQSHLEAVRYD